MSSTPLKAAALLELTGGIASDRSVKNTMGYYWTVTQSKLFTPLSVYDTMGSLDKTLELLNKYYSEGYRIFIGFSRSTILAGCLEWFNTHPEAIGISISSSANSLAIDKSIYRLQIVDSFTIDAINVPLEETINNNGKIFYIYSENEVATQELYDILKETYGETNIIPYAANSTNLTLENVNTFFYVDNSVSANDTVVLYLFAGDQRQAYVNLFTTTNNLSIPANQYDLTSGGLPELDNEKTTLTNTYYVLGLENIINSKLFDEGASYLGKQFSTNTLNALYLAQSLMYKSNINNIFSYAGTLQFNEYKDIKYGSSKLYKYINPNYNGVSVYTDDPLYGKLTLYKVN